MDLTFRSPLVDLFRRGDVPRDARMLAARGAVAPRAQDQLTILVLLTGDTDPEVARQAAATLDRLPQDALRACLARADTPSELREFFVARGVQPLSGAPAGGDDPLVDTPETLPEVPEAAEDAAANARVLSNLPVGDRLKLAMKGTREQRAQLIRDTNRLVAAAVLSSPRLTEAEVEGFARMANVSEDVLRVIGSNRSWMKNYAIVVGLARNPKTPPAISMHLLHRLNERDTKMLAIDRNVPEALRIAARQSLLKGHR